jgi:tetraacyldisaccharide 4'-kinase
VAGVKEALLEAGAALYGAAWEARRSAYAHGLFAPRRAECRVVSVGNLTVGGTGKTTLTLHLARRALAAGVKSVVVCRRYRPGPGGFGDEEALYRKALGRQSILAAVIGASKRDLAMRAASRAALVLVDDGFSHWGLARDVDLVLLDASDPLGQGRLLPAGRLREPLRALQRADAVIISRLPAGEDPGPLLDLAHAYAPGARLAAGRHRISGLEPLVGGLRPPRARARVVTATGNPDAVAASAREAGYATLTLARYRDHHWFTTREMRAELVRARADDADLVITPKDAVRWTVADPDVMVLQVEWEWVSGGDEIERLVLGTQA